MTTIREVAAAAGVSIKTVSRVLNNEPYVGAETRERVHEAVRTLGYMPNIAARALAGSKSYLIGLYFRSFSTIYGGALQYGAMSRCREAGYHITVDMIADDPEVAKAQIRTSLAQLRVDGVILPPPICDRADVMDILDAAGTPYARISPSTDIDRGPRVYIDERAAATEMTRHLLELGHRTIGFIGGPPGHSASPARLQGFLDALKEAGLSPRPELIEHGLFTFRSGEAAAERLLNAPEPPSAIFAGNDDMALGVLAVANRLNLSVPGDLSVAGFDDSPIAQIVWPQLTTVRQPIAALAAEAVDLLVSGPSATRPAESRLLLHEMVVRGSTGEKPS